MGQGRQPRAGARAWARGRQYSPTTPGHWTPKQTQPRRGDGIGRARAREPPPAAGLSPLAPPSPLRGWGILFLPIPRVETRGYMPSPLAGLRSNTVRLRCFYVGEGLAPSRAGASPNTVQFSQ